MSELIKSLRNGLASYKPTALELMAADKIEQQTKEIESLRAELEQYKIDCNELCIERENFIEELAALKQTSEPRAWIYPDSYGNKVSLCRLNKPIGWDEMDECINWFETPLYLAAPAQKEGYVSVKDLQKIINGDYQRARKSEQCKHGRYGYEDCESCVEEQIDLLINAAQHEGE